MCYLFCGIHGSLSTSCHGSRIIGTTSPPTPRRSRRYRFTRRSKTSNALSSSANVGIWAGPVACRWAIRCVALKPPGCIPQGLDVGLDVATLQAGRTGACELIEFVLGKPNDPGGRTLRLRIGDMNALGRR